MTSLRETRLVIAQRPTRRDHLHGAWWPRSTELGQELAPMLAAVGQRFHTFLGVMLNRDEWSGHPMIDRRASIGRAKISWYGLVETHLVVLRCGDSRRIALLLLPPSTPERVALTATLMASTPGNVLGTDETMSKARALAAAPASGDQ